ncbi:unnamed protein product [Closterium sp. NIES-53]
MYMGGGVLGTELSGEGSAVAGITSAEVSNEILCDSVGTGTLKKPPSEVVVRWISRAWKAVPADLIKRAFLTCGISNALDGSEDGLAMAHRRRQLTAEVDVDDSIIADGFFGKNCQEPKSDEEE